MRRMGATCSLHAVPDEEATAIMSKQFRHLKRGWCSATFYKINCDPQITVTVQLSPLQTTDTQSDTQSNMVCAKAALNTHKTKIRKQHQLTAPTCALTAILAGAPSITKKLV